MARRKTWTPGSIEPLDGRCYFVHPESRMTRVWDLKTLPVPEKQGWVQVTAQDFDVFRKETKSLSPIKRKKLHALLYKKDTPCESAQPSPKPSTSKSPTKTLKPSARKSSESSASATTRKKPTAPARRKKS